MKITAKKGKPMKVEYGGNEMKPEPLKGKGREFKDLETYDMVLNTVLFRKHEIKSAVEWLKEEIEKYRLADVPNVDSLLIDVDKAFEDITK